MSDIRISWASHVALVVKNPSANAGDKRDSGSIPGWGAKILYAVWCGQKLESKF